MDPSVPLTMMDPRPISSPFAPNSHPYSTAPLPGPDSGIGLRLGPESQIPDHPGSAIEIPRPPSQTFNSYQPAVATTTARATLDVKNVRAATQHDLKEYARMIEMRRSGDVTAATMEFEGQFRAQQALVIGNLKMLQGEMRNLAKAAENHRWRRWLVGGAIAMLIPAIRKIFRRNHDSESVKSSNDTEYAFRKSKGLLAHIKDSMLGNGSFASVAFFVFAVLYVFQNEVSLRVARTVQKRIKKLTSKVKSGDWNVDAHDLRALEGWRWRVLLW